MSYNPISGGEITTGQPVQSTTLNKVKDNFESLNERVTSLESGGSTLYPPIIFRVNGTYGEPGDFDVSIHGEGILKTTLNFGITITGVRILIDKCGLSGVTEVDLKYKRGESSYTSILNTRPSVAYGAGDDSVSINAIINPSESSLQAGDILRLDITSAQVRAKNIVIRVDYIKE